MNQSPDDSPLHPGQKSPTMGNNYSSIIQRRFQELAELLGDPKRKIPLDDFLSVPSEKSKPQDKLAWEIARGRGLHALSQSGNLLEIWHIIIMINEGFYSADENMVKQHSWEIPELMRRKHGLLQEGRMPKWTQEDRESIYNGVMNLTREGQIARVVYASQLAQIALWIESRLKKHYTYMAHLEARPAVIDEDLWIAQGNRNGILSDEGRVKIYLETGKEGLWGNIHPIEKNDMMTLPTWMMINTKGMILRISWGATPMGYYHGRSEVRENIGQQIRFAAEG